MVLKGKRVMDDKKLFRISDVAKMFRVSTGTLRHYEKAGLLCPEHTDQETGYRYYSVRQFEVLNTIRYLRALDLPLDEIAEFLHNRDIEVIEEKLAGLPYDIAGKTGTAERTHCPEKKGTGDYRAKD